MCHLGARAACFFILFTPHNFMRNKVLLGFGLACFSLAAVSFVDASRYVYHQYQRLGYTQTQPSCGNNCQVTQVRPHSRSVYNGYANYYRNLSRNIYRPKCDVRDQYGCHYYNKQQLYRPAKDELDYKLQRPHLYPRIENTIQTNRLVVRNGNYKDQIVPYNGEPTVNDLAVVDAGTYTLDTMGFTKDGSGTYRQQGTSLAFRVLSSPSDYKCSQTNFWSCVARLTSNFQAAQNLGSISNLNRDFRWNDTEHLSFQRFPTVTESFDAHGRTYFIFSALNPADGSIVRIEGVATQGDKNAAAQAMYQVFESFRFVY